MYMYVPSGRLKSWTEWDEFFCGHSWFFFNKVSSYVDNPVYYLYSFLERLGSVLFFLHCLFDFLTTETCHQKTIIILLLD